MLNNVLYIFFHLTINNYNFFYKILLISVTDMWLSLLIGLFLSDLRNICAITLNFDNQNQVRHFKIQFKINYFPGLGYANNCFENRLILGTKRMNSTTSFLKLARTQMLSILLSYWQHPLKTLFKRDK